MSRRPSAARVAGTLLLVAAILALGLGTTVYKFRDCKKVGHTTLYCILDMDK